MFMIDEAALTSGSIQLKLRLLKVGVAKKARKAVAQNALKAGVKSWLSTACP